MFPAILRIAGESFPGVCQKSDMIVFFYGGVEAVFKSFIANFVAIFVEPN